MSTLFNLSFMLPTLYMLQLMSPFGPSRSPVTPAVRDTFLSDLE